MTKAIDFNGIFTPRHHYGAVLSILLIALLFGLAMLYQYPASNAGQADTYAGRPVAKTNAASVSTVPAQNYKELCGKYPKTAGEVSCEEAAKLALKSYKGEVYDIKLAKSEIPKGPGRYEWKDVWILKVKLEKTIELKQIKEKADNLELFIDRKTGELLKVQAL